jgi:hypothetical protein
LSLTVHPALQPDPRLPANPTWPRPARRRPSTADCFKKSFCRAITQAEVSAGKRGEASSLVDFLGRLRHIQPKVNCAPQAALNGHAT